MFEKIFAHPKTQELVRHGIEKGIDYIKDRLDKLDKPVTSEIKSYSPEVNKYISSLEELKIYKEAKLEEGEVNGKKALLKPDIDFKLKDEFGRTNLERMKNGNPPVYKNCEIIELHHVGQKPDSPLAELTSSEHRGKGNDVILHDKAKETEIDRNAFAKERQAHWQSRAEGFERD